jgi:hypothetical protein
VLALEGRSIRVYPGDSGLPGVSGFVPDTPGRKASTAIFWVRGLLTPKFGKESDLWVRFEKESVWWKEGYFQRFSAKRSTVGYLLRFGKGTVELILRD